MLFSADNSVEQTLIFYPLAQVSRPVPVRYLEAKDINLLQLVQNINL